MKKYYKLFLTLFAFTVVLSSCESDDDSVPDFVSFERGPLNAGVAVGESATYDVKVFTNNITSADRQFTVNVDAASTLGSGAYTVPSTVTIPGGSNEGLLSVQVADVGLGLTARTLQLSLQDESGFFVGRPYLLNVTRTCEGRAFVVNLTLDSYPGETGWELLDANGVSVLKVTNVAATRALCIPSGTYTFILTDSYGDGIFNGGATLSYAGEELATLSGEFATETSVEVSF